jgi:hypothetical protein
MQGMHSPGQSANTSTTMKSTLLKAATAVSIVLATVSCTTTYDAQGNPVQSVDPAAAAAGMVAAGVLGAAISNNNDDNHYYYGRRGGYHHHHGPRRRRR